jgi:hypothetical protein
LVDVGADRMLAPFPGCRDILPPLRKVFSGE